MCSISCRVYDLGLSFQSFGSARAIYWGQEHEGDYGEITRLYEEFVVDEVSDVDKVPLQFTSQDFGQIYRRNFSRSSVVVDRVVNLIYFFSVGMTNYADEKTMERNPIRLF
jgi:hypothetical protein